MGGKGETSYSYERGHQVGRFRRADAAGDANDRKDSGNNAMATVEVKVMVVVVAVVVVAVDEEKLRGGRRSGGRRPSDGCRR